MMGRLSRLVLGAAATVAAFSALLLPGTAHAATDHGAAMLSAARTRAGDWYAYGSAGPATFDCSGLVMWAAKQAGVTLPHNTVAMLSSGHLTRTYSPQPGDLAFFGTGHVEIVDRGHDVTFGAQQTGTRVGDHTWSVYWHPTAYYVVH
jgi:cell wall-associated NlpC family hydrolase